MSIKIILIIVLILCFIGAEMKITGIAEEEMEEMMTKVTYDNMNITFNEEGNNQDLTFIPRAVNKYADLLLFVATDGSKYAINYGYEHPQYNYKLAWRLLIISLFIVFIKPLIYLFCFLGYFGILIYNKIKRWKGKTK